MTPDSYARADEAAGALRGRLGGKGGSWAYTGLGVLVALAVGFVVPTILSRGTVRAQEAHAA